MVVIRLNLYGSSYGKYLQKKHINPIIYMGHCGDVEFFNDLKYEIIDYFEIIYYLHKEGKYEFLEKEKLKELCVEYDNPDYGYDGIAEDIIQSAKSMYDNDDSYFSEMVTSACEQVDDEYSFTFEVDGSEIYIDKNDSKRAISEKIKKITEFLKKLTEYCVENDISIEYDRYSSTKDPNRVIELYLEDLKEAVETSIKYESNDVNDFKHIKLLAEVLQEDYNIEISSWYLDELKEKIQKLEKNN